MLIIRNIVYYICIAVKYHVKISDVADALVASPTNIPHSSLLTKWIFDPIAAKLIQSIDSGDFWKRVFMAS